MSHIEGSSRLFTAQVSIVILMIFIGMNTMMGWRPPSNFRLGGATPDKPPPLQLPRAIFPPSEELCAWDEAANTSAPRRARIPPRGPCGDRREGQNRSSKPRDLVR